MKRSARFTIGCAGILALFFVLALQTASPALGQQKIPSQGDYYHIGPDDVLSIFVWKESDLTMDVTVLPDGRITFPLVGEVMAAGRTVGELRDVMTEKLSEYVEAPEVTVVVRDTRSRRIYTIGKVNSPGPYPLAPDMTVLQALSTAGGFAEWADEEQILIIRRKGSDEKQIKFNYKDFISGKNPEQNILLEPYDTIVVP
ncbi:MAG: polysaccharide biosynthesis/export family protein [Desulfobacteraceae bacterium]